MTKNLEKIAGLPQEDVEELAEAGKLVEQLLKDGTPLEMIGSILEMSHPDTLGKAQKIVSQDPKDIKPL